MPNVHFESRDYMLNKFVIRENDWFPFEFYMGMAHDIKITPGDPLFASPNVYGWDVDEVDPNVLKGYQQADVPKECLVATTPQQLQTRCRFRFEFDILWEDRNKFTFPKWMFLASGGLGAADVLIEARMVGNAQKNPKNGNVMYCTEIEKWEPPEEDPPPMMPDNLVKSFWVDRIKEHYLGHRRAPQDIHLRESSANEDGESLPDIKHFGPALASRVAEHCVIIPVQQPASNLIICELRTFKIFIITHTDTWEIPPKLPHANFNAQTMLFNGDYFLANPFRPVQTNTRCINGGIIRSYCWSSYAAGFDLEVFGPCRRDPIFPRPLGGSGCKALAFNVAVG